MFVLVILMLVTGVLDTFMTGRIDHWIPMLLGIFVGCLAIKVFDGDE